MTEQRRIKADPTQEDFIRFGRVLWEVVRTTEAKTIRLVNAARGRARTYRIMAICTDDSND